MTAEVSSAAATAGSVRSVRRTYRQIARAVPDPVRHAFGRLPGAPRMRDWIFQGPRTHDELYNAEYFAMVERTSAMSVGVVADAIVSAFRPTTLIDVGCGTGTLLSELQARDVLCRGLEYATAAIDACRSRGLDVRRFDVESDILPTDIGRSDVAISMEVGQQLHPDSSDRYVDLLSSLADTVVFSSAVPGQGDRSPRNEQTHEFWIGKFAERGFQLDDRLSTIWRDKWKEQNTAPWFWSNVMVLRRARSLSRDE